MREIKFRAWDNENKKWIEDKFYVDKNGQVYLLEDACVPGDSEHLSDFSVDVELVQFTGLWDKNGKEIFEGDIIRRGIYTSLDCGCITDASIEIEQVESLSDFFECKGYNEGELAHDYGPKYLEVIGNIFENPELLERD